MKTLAVLLAAALAAAAVLLAGAGPVEAADADANALVTEGGLKCSIYVNLVLDVSGSMTREKRQEMRQAAKTAMGDLRRDADDGVKIYYQLTTFQTTAKNHGTVQEFHAGAFGRAVNDAVPLRDTINGATNHGAALALAEKNLEANAGLDVKTFVVMLITDGQTTVSTVHGRNTRKLDHSPGSQLNKATKAIHARQNAKLAVVFAAPDTTSGGKDTRQDILGRASTVKPAGANTKNNKKTALSASVNDMKEVRAKMATMFDRACDDTVIETPPPEVTRECKKRLYVTLVSDISRSIQAGGNPTAHVRDTWKAAAAAVEPGKFEVFVRVLAYAGQVHTIVPEFVPAADVGAVADTYEFGKGILPGSGSNWERAWFTKDGGDKVWLEDTTLTGKALRHASGLPPPPDAKHKHVTVLITDAASYDASEKCKAAFSKVAEIFKQHKTADNTMEEAHAAAVSTPEGELADTESGSCCDENEDCNIATALETLQGQVAAVFIGSEFRNEHVVGLLGRKTPESVVGASTVDRMPEMTREAIFAAEAHETCTDVLVKN